MTDNPFEAPKSTVSDMQTSAAAGELRDIPRKNSIGFGWKWIKEGFGIFKKAPLIWILIYIIFIALNVIPVVSMVASLLFPILIAGLYFGAHEVDHDRPLKVGHLFEGFKQNTSSLFAVTGLYLLGIIICLALAVIVAVETGSFDSFTQVAMQEGAGATDPMAQFDLMKALLLPMLVYFAVVIPLAMSVWFAPALIIINDMGAIESMKRSFSGCIKNMFPYLLFGIIGTVLLILGMLPLLLGLLIVLPALMAATYASYKDIFLD